MCAFRGSNTIQSDGNITQALALKLLKPPLPFLLKLLLFCHLMWDLPEIDIHNTDSQVPVCKNKSKCPLCEWLFTPRVAQALFMGVRIRHMISLFCLVFFFVLLTQTGFPCEACLCLPVSIWPSPWPFKQGPAKHLSPLCLHFDLVSYFQLPSVLFFSFVFTLACVFFFAVTSFCFYIIARFFSFPLLPLSEQSSSLSCITARQALGASC